MTAPPSHALMVRGAPTVWASEYILRPGRQYMSHYGSRPGADFRDLPFLFNFASSSVKF